MSSKENKTKRVGKIVFFCSACFLLFCYGYLSHRSEIFPYPIMASVEDSLRSLYHEAATLLKIRPDHFLQPARYEGDGVTVNDLEDREEDLVFLSGFFHDNNELRLIRRNGAILARWPVHFKEIFPQTRHLQKPPATDRNVDIHGAVALPDGSIVFNFEYAGMVKLDRCGEIVWTLAKMAHHSIELAENGGFWVPGRRQYSKGDDSPFPPFQAPMDEDTLMKISEDGKVLLEISTPKLFCDNGLEALLTATGYEFRYGWKGEITHLNKIVELSSGMAKDFPSFKVGDLLLSFRNRNLILVVDPEKRKIKWWRIGPWIRQHDPEFIPGGKIILFNNNIYRTAFGKNRKDVCSLSIPRISNIMEVDPVTDQCKVIYGMVGGQEMLSIIRGKVEQTRNGGLLVTEFEGGRVFETDPAGRIIWEFINRYDSDEVAEITEARVYPAGYFRVSDWAKGCRKSNQPIAPLKGSSEKVPG